MTVRQRAKYCDVCVTFKEWLAKNGHRFNRKCKIRHYNKGTSTENFMQSIIAIYLVQHKYINNDNFQEICQEAFSELGLNIIC